MAWSSEQYLKFRAQRTQPAIDLAARIPLSNPAKIIDIGCGPGNSTRVLKNRYPQADILGIDSSEDMIAAAQRDNADMRFMRLDAANGLGTLGEKYDIVFSNACLQWLPDHPTILQRLTGLLNEGGILAVQIPMNYSEPIHKIIGALVKSDRWRDKLGTPRIFHTLPQEKYFDVLAELTSDFEIWQTIYFHRMPSHEDIMEWYKGAGLRPYMEALSADDAELFCNEVRARVEREYPIQANGEIIFRFPRFFFIARKGGTP